MHWIEKISYREREKRKLKLYQIKREKYINISADELEMNYIQILSRYENKKITLLAVMSTIFISILSNVWKYFFQMIKELMVYICKNAGNAEPAKTAILVTVALAAVLLCIMIIIIISFLYNMRIITEEKIIIERIVNNS